MAMASDGRGLENAGPLPDQNAGYAATAHEQSQDRQSTSNLSPDTKKIESIPSSAAINSSSTQDTQEMSERGEATSPTAGAGIPPNPSADAADTESTAREHKEITSHTMQENEQGKGSESERVHSSTSLEVSRPISNGPGMSRVVEEGSHAPVASSNAESHGTRTAASQARETTAHEAVEGSAEREEEELHHPTQTKDGQQTQAPAPEAANPRPESLLASPLTHPSGVNMFPSMSTAQQEQMSWEALTQAEETIVADTDGLNRLNDNMSDGGYESEGFSSGSTSAESSIRDYMYENGRRYHRFREGSYNFPNDDVEQEREDMKHAMVKLLCGQKLHFAPIGENPQEVLDIGTGTGIWVIEMGDQFPSAHVVGIDLSPIQPDWLPPNVRFIVDDAESPWLYPRNHFDYVHSRNTVMAIKDWLRLFRRAFEHIKPGGWIELQEIHHRPRSATPSGELPPEHPVAEFWSHVTAGLAELGVDLNISSEGRLARMLQETGFVNVTERVLHVPIGTWPKNKVLKTVGLYWRTILLDGIQAIALGPMTRGLLWKREEVEVFLTSVRTAYQDNAALMYMPLHVIYAQKPGQAA